MGTQLSTTLWALCPGGWGPLLYTIISLSCVVLHTCLSTHTGVPPTHAAAPHTHVHHRLISLLSSHQCRRSPTCYTLTNAQTPTPTHPYLKLWGWGKSFLLFQSFNAFKALWTSQCCSGVRRPGREKHTVQMTRTGDRDSSPFR